MNLKNKCIHVKYDKNHASNASTFQIKWILKIDSEKDNFAHSSRILFIFLNSSFLIPSCKVFQTVFFVIFIIADDFYLRTCPIDNFE